MTSEMLEWARRGQAAQRAIDDLLGPKGGDPRERELAEAWDEVERLRDELGRQYAKINAVWELMQQTPFSQHVPKVDLVTALVEGSDPT